MNYEYRERDPITRTRIVPLTPAQEAAVHAKLAADEVRAETLREQLPAIIARAHAARAARVAMVFAVHWRLAKLRHMAKHQLTLPLWEREMVVSMPPDMMPSIREALYLCIEIKEAS